MGSALTVSLLTSFAGGQHTGGGGTAAGGAGAGGANTRNNNSTTTGNNNYGTNPFDLGNKGIYLSGRVQMEDGSAPQEQVLIERVCGGFRKAEAYTDLKGRFSFQLGQQAGVMADATFEGTTGATDPSNISPGTITGGTSGSSGSQARLATNDRTAMNRSLIGCELKASLPGFRSDAVNLSGRRLLDNPDIGTLLLHRLTNVEGTTISATTLQAPKDARKAYDKAREALRKDKLADAQKELEKAVGIYPQFATAWYQLGVLQDKSNQAAEARKSYAHAIEADPKLVSPYLPLALLAARDRNWQEVAATTSRLLKLDSVDFPEGYYYNAAANYNLAKPDEAEVSARQAVKLDTAHRFPQALHILGLILYQKNDYTGAAEQLRSYQRVAPNAADAEQVKQQLAELDRLVSESKAAADKPQQP
jgi:tetratricopeptide (TPR) repeat protein